MRISTSSASELLMLLNVLSGSFEASTGKIKCADYKNNRVLLMIKAARGLV